MRQVDVVVVGGGPAGLSAALCLGRSRRSAVVIDAGSPRHAVAAAVQNFLTRDGLPPHELRAIAWEQMARYPSVDGPIEGRVVDARRAEGRWLVETDSGATFSARAILVATGMIDEHPQIPGFAERWGSSIHQCPYCHGWEVRDQPVAVLAKPEAALHLAPLLRGWTEDVAVFTNGATPSDDERQALADLGIPMCDQPIAELRGPGPSLEEIVLENGSSMRRKALFAVSEQRQVPFVSALELELGEAGYVVVDQMMKTSRDGIWAAGDLTSRMQQVVEAAAQGFRAGAMIQANLTIS